MPEKAASDQTPPTAITPRKVVRLGEGDAPMYYINNTEIGLTTWDVSLRLARIEKIDAEALYVRDQALVTMSLQHAKTVVMILSAHLEQYEKDNGPLATPLLRSTGRVEIDLPTSMFAPRLGEGSSPGTEKQETKAKQ